MATMRSIATLESLLADNTTGLISPEDVRDAIIATIAPGHGEIYISSTAATTLTDTTTWVQIGGTYTLSANNMHWAMTQNGRLYYTGEQPRILHIAMTLSFTTASNNQVIEVGCSKDGTIIAASVVQRKVGTGTDVGSTAVHAFTTISNGEYINGVIRNTTSGSNVTATKLNLFIMDMAL